MKNLTLAFMDRLDETVKTLALCIRIIRRDTTEFLFTSHDRDLTFCGLTFKTIPGFMPTPIQVGTTSEVGTFSIDVDYSADGIEKEELISGRFSGAKAFVYLVDYRNLPTVLIQPDHKTGSPKCTITDETTYYKLVLDVAQATWAVGDRICYGSDRFCWISEIIDTTSCKVTDRFGEFSTLYLATAVDVLEISPGVSFIWYSAYLGDVDVKENRATLNFNSLLQFLRNSIGIQVTTSCRARFCDMKLWTREAEADRECKLDPASYTFTGEVTVIVEANLTFQATVAGCTTSEYFSNGELIWTNGYNESVTKSIKQHTYSAGIHTFELFQPANLTIEVGDTFNVLAGCNLTLQNCMYKFLSNNSENFRGFPTVPGLDNWTQMPQEV